MNQFAHDVSLQVTLGSQYAKAIETPSELQVFLTPEQAADHSKEQQLLTLLSAWTLYQDAGFESHHIAPTPANTESQALKLHHAPVMPEPLQAIFKRYFSDKYERHQLQLPHLMWMQWMTTATYCNAVMPNHLLVSFLSNVDTSQRGASLDLMSERALWLGQQNPAWHWVQAASPIHIDDQGQLDDASHNLWQHADKNVRTLLLQRLRQLDPALGLQQLQHIWSSIDAEQRDSLLQQLRPHLSELDIDFLQQVLASDRSRFVKHTATYLLSMLPQSDFYQELTALFTQCVQYNSSDKSIHIDINPELLQQLKNRSLHGQGAKLLQQQIQKTGDIGLCIAFLCSVFPLDCWSNLIAKNAALFHAMQKSIWADSIFAGMRIAVTQQSRQDWMSALFEYNHALLHPKDDPYIQPTRFALLPTAQRELLMQTHCKRLTSGYHYDHIRLCWDQLFSTLSTSPLDALISDTLANECLAFIQAHPRREHACAWLKDFLILASSPAWVATTISQFDAMQQQLWQTRQRLIALISPIQDDNLDQ